MNYRFNFYIGQLSEKCSMSSLKAMIILGKENIEIMNGLKNIVKILIN